MEYAIEGELAQCARLKMKSGETCWASRGALMSLDRGVEWSLKVPGGVGGAARRALAGENLALLHIAASREGEEVILSSNQPGKVAVWDVGEEAVITTRGSFLAAFGPDIRIDVTIARRAGAALFGGAGLFLQKISGRGQALIHGAGDFIERKLQEKESLLVSTGNLAAFSERVDYNIQGIAGCRRILFGGEGLFMTRLTGPGRVLLQTLKRHAGRQKTTSSSG